MPFGIHKKLPFFSYINLRWTEVTGPRSGENAIELLSMAADQYAGVARETCVRKKPGLFEPAGFIFDLAQS